ncbi:hypothetical protein Tco_1064466 [Tanacetum coccineum]
MAGQHRVVLAAHGYDGCLSRRCLRELIRVAILEVEIKAHSQKIMYFVGVSESSMFSHFPQRPVGVNRSSHVGSSNRQPSLGDKGSIPSGSSTPNQTTSSKGVDVLSIVNTQAVPSRVLNSPPVVLQATTHAGTSGSNQRKRTHANTQAELAVAEGSSLNTVCRCDSADTKRR